MATTGATLSSIANALKVFYLPAMRSQLNKGTILMNRLKKNEENVEGKSATVFLETGFNPSKGARADNGQLPAAYSGVPNQTIIPIYYNYSRFSITGPTIEATKSDKGSVKRVVDWNVKNTTESLKKDINRQLWGCGFGVLARWRTTASATSYTLQKMYRGNSAGGNGFGSTFGAKYMQADSDTSLSSKIVAVVLTGGTGIVVDATPLNPTAKVTSVTTYDTITVSDPGVTEAAGTFYVLGDANGANVGGTTAITRYEMMGLRGIVTDEVLDHILTDGTTPGVTTDATLQGLAISDWWQANVIYCGGENQSLTRYAQQNPLTLHDMQRAFDASSEYLGVEFEPTLILMPFALKRKVVDLLVGDKRYNTMKLDGGYTAIEFNGKPIVVDDDAIGGEIYFLYEPSLQIYRMSDFNWMDRDGNVLSRVADYDAYESTLYAYMNMGVDRRRANSVLVDIDY